MQGLNSRQLQAVKQIDRPMLVLAGAGSGKTRVITQKIAYLIQECGIKAHHIAAVTFTNKAAREMKERVGQLIPRQQTRGLKVSTFHTLGLSIIKSELRALSLKSGFSIFDSQDVISLLKELMRREFDSDEMVDSMQHQISSWKNECLTPDDVLLKVSGDPHEVAAAQLYVQYNRYLRAYNAVDFDDLIMLPVILFRQQPDTLNKWRQKMRYLLVDEYQDTNTTQYELVRQLVEEGHGLTVVGDDDQSIYCWRGAQPENLALLAKDFPGLNVIKLEQNYRSTSVILKAANTLIANNPHVFEKALWSEMGYGKPLQIMRAPNEEKEANYVVAQLVQEHFQHKRQYSDYAILYRGNHQSRIFEKHLREQQVPYRLSGGMSFFEYSEVKDIMAYLRLLVNPDDDNAFLRIVNTPRRQLGATTVEKLAQYANEQEISLFSASEHLAMRERLSSRAATNLEQFVEMLSSISEQADRENPIKAVQRLLTRVDYEAWLMETSKNEVQAQRRWENVQDLVAWLQRLYEQAEFDENSLGDLVSKMMLLDIMERQAEEEEGDKVTLMTLHASKGLEFPFVFLVGMEEELLPHRTSIEEDNIEEERRLCYVGITRAQKELTLTLSAQRKRYGEVIDCMASRFIDELPQEDLQWLDNKPRLEGKARKAHANANLASIRDILGD